MSDPNETAAYEAARGWLEQSPPGFIYPKVVPSIVNMRDVVLQPIPSEAGQEGEDLISLRSPGKTKALLNAALENLDGLEKEEANLIHASPWTVPLTQIVTNEAVASTQQALEQLQACASASPRRVCQYPFKKNDIVWMCRTCQNDETCALCHECFSNSDHKGHDVAFFHAQEGGCCDCGDPDGTCCTTVLLLSPLFACLLTSNLSPHYYSLGPGWILSPSWTSGIVGSYQ